MKFTFSTTASTTPFLIFPLTKATQNENQVREFCTKYELKPQLIKDFFNTQQPYLFSNNKEGHLILLLKLKDRPNYSSICHAFRKMAHEQQAFINKSISIYIPHSIEDTDFNTSHFIQAAVNGMVLSQYNIGLYKTDKPKTRAISKSNFTINFISEAQNEDSLQEAAQVGKQLAYTQMEIMNLINAPGNKATPTDLAKWAKKSAAEYQYSVKVYTKKQIEKLGLGALLGVNRGSEYPPTFIVMEYQAKKKKKDLEKICLVGKGVTFDTGGLSIKGHQNMHYMKSDMGGAAAVFGTLEMTAKLQLPIHLIGIVPATDNCVDALSIKPGDILTGYSGKTIEIIDTDAEGRLILSDALSYAVQNYKPDVLIDLATLTGSAVRTFGYQAGALFSNDEQLSKELQTAGERTGERLWPLPIWDEYQKDIESDVADVKNFSGRPLAGAIAAAKFLEYFIEEHPSWAHLDIAGVAFGDTGFSKYKSATGYGIHLLINFLKNRA